MQNFFQQLENTFQATGALHHAYFVVGEVEGGVESLKSFLEHTVKVTVAGNPDFWHRQFDVFTVDDARVLASSQDRMSFVTNTDSTTEPSLGLKVFIIQTNSITEQAQNALLKIFEEPTAGTHFFILMPQDTLLPTLKSRVQTIVQQTNTSTTHSDILHMSYPDKLKIIKEITEGIKDEEKTKQDAIDLVNVVEKNLYTVGVEKSYEKLLLCQKARIALHDNGAPIKMILESLFIAL